MKTPQPHKPYKAQGDRLRLERIKQLMRAKDLSERSGIHPVVLSRIENGHTRLTPMNASRCAKVLGVDMEYLLEGNKK